MPQGRIPGDPTKLAGHRKTQPFKLVEGKPAPQPKLPTVSGFKWPQITREWWAMWGDMPLSDDFTAVDWSELLIAARLHATVWDVDTTPQQMKSAAAELRLRVGKFGATPSDRQRLRITFAVADKAEDDVEAARQRRGARSRRGPHLASVPRTDADDA